MFLITDIGRYAINTFSQIGEFAIFVSKIFCAAFDHIYLKKFLKQLVVIGFYSLPVVGLTAIFTGAVLALQSYTGFSRFNAESSIASVVVLSITRELGPVLAGLMLAGRVGASIAAQIGTMKVTEQIDALYTLKTNPFGYLFLPRVLAGIVVLPLLVMIADIIGVMGGYIVGVYQLGFSPAGYISATFEFLESDDIISGLIKASFFGFIVTSIGCYSGYKSKGGAEGVGKSTTVSVVTSSILVLCSNYLITKLLFIS